MKSILAAFLISLSLIRCWSAEERSFRLTLRVVDESGRAVSGAEASVTYENMDALERSNHFVTSRELSDDQGCITARATMFLDRLTYGAKKVGYYESTGLKYHFSGFDDGRWLPWNPVIEIVLKHRANPIPMYAKNMELKLPEFDKAIGYDLVVGDWVVPYGAGERPDFVFEARRAVRSDRDYEGVLILRFPNPEDGLVPFDKPREDGSELRLPYLAPQDGYVEERTWREERRPAPDGHDIVRSDAVPTMNYYFRVRSVVDAEGKVVAAYYGKIHGDIRFFIGTQAPRSGLAFTYYLNPDGTRNVEFDPQRNLFQPAKPDDRAFWNLGP